MISKTPAMMRGGSRFFRASFAGTAATAFFILLFLQFLEAANDENLSAHRREQLGKNKPQQKKGQKIVESLNAFVRRVEISQTSTGPQDSSLKITIFSSGRGGMMNGTGLRPELTLVKTSTNGTLIVGDAVYREPYNQYGREVASVLHGYTDKHHDDLMGQAQWLQMLGLAHKARAERFNLQEELSDKVDDFDIEDHKDLFSNDEDITNNNDEYADILDEYDDNHNANPDADIDRYGMGDEDEGEIKQALHAFKLASDIYLRLRDEEGTTDQTVRYDAMYGLAGIYVQISEVYFMSGTMDHDSSLSILYMTKAEELYRAVADGSSHHKDVGVKRASCCFRVGYMIIEERSDNIEACMKAIRYLDEAISIYDEAIGKESSLESLVELRWSLALVWQSKTTAATKRDNHVGTIENGEKAVKIFQKVLDDKNEGDDDETVAEQMGDLYLKIAEAYLQQSSYNEASTSFEQSMAIHDKYELVPRDPCYTSGILDWSGDGDSELYEEALEEEDDEMTDTDEADLRAGLGSIYLAENEGLEASSHLKVAVRLYERSGDDVDTGVLADTKYNLAFSYCQSFEYTESARMYREAMELYRVASVGGSIHPFRRDKRVVL